MRADPTIEGPTTRSRTIRFPVHARTPRDDSPSPQARPEPRRPRPRHRWSFEQLEDRTLLSAVPGADVLAAVAPKIALGIPTTGTLAPGEVAFFQIDPTTDGRLVAQVHAAGATTRLSLLDAQGQVLMQSDGQSPDNPTTRSTCMSRRGPTILRWKTSAARAPTP